MKTEYICSLPPIPEPHQSVTEGDYDKLENLGVTLFTVLQFLSENGNEQSPNLSGSRPTVQGMHLDPQLSEVISLLMLPLATASTLVLPKHWPMDQ